MAGSNPFIPDNIGALAGFGRGDEAYDINNQRTMGTESWFISADEIFKSNMDSPYNKHAACYDVDVFFAHNIQGNITSPSITSSGVLVAGNVKVYMSAGSHSAAIKKMLYTSKKIANISLDRVAIVGGDKAPVQEMSFNNCMFCSFQQKNDTIMFSFRFTDCKDSYTEYDQNGDKKGAAAVSFNFAKWVAGDGK